MRYKIIIFVCAFMYQMVHKLRVEVKEIGYMDKLHWAIATQNMQIS